MIGESWGVLGRHLTLDCVEALELPEWAVLGPVFESSSTLLYLLGTSLMLPVLPEFAQLSSGLPEETCFAHYSPADSSCRLEIACCFSGYLPTADVIQWDSLPDGSPARC